MQSQLEAPRLDRSDSRSEERQWLQRLVDKDPQALQELIERYHRSTLLFVLRSVDDKHLAEDITQDVFLSLYASLERYDPERALEPWIHTIASNKIRDHFRSRHFQEGRRSASVEDGGADHVPSEVDGPGASIQRGESAGRLRAAIDELSDKLRSTVLLRLDQGLSFAAIAELLGSGEAAVRKRFSRAMASLQESLVVEPVAPCADGAPCR